MLVVKRRAELNTDSLSAVLQFIHTLKHGSLSGLPVCFSGLCVFVDLNPSVCVCLQVCAVEGGCSVALRPQHEGGQDVAGGEERQLDQAAGGGVMVAGVASVHGQVPADRRGWAERAEAPQASSWSPCTSCSSCSSCTSGGGRVCSGVLFLPLGPAVLEPDLDLGLSEGKRQGQVEPLAH